MDLILSWFEFVIFVRDDDGGVETLTMLNVQNTTGSTDSIKLDA
jgi:hypothetical protein